VILLATGTGLVLPLELVELLELGAGAEDFLPLPHAASSAQASRVVAKRGSFASDFMVTTLKPMKNGQSVIKINEDCVTLSRQFVAQIFNATRSSQNPCIGP